MQFYPLSPVNEFLFIYLEIFFITTLKTHAVLILIIYSQIQPIFIANHPILEDFHRLSPDFLLRFFSVIHIFLLRSSYLIFNFLLCFFSGKHIFLLRFFSEKHIFLLRSSYLIFNFLLCFPILIYYH